MSQTIAIKLGELNTGLTLVAQPIDPATGLDDGTAITTGFVEIGGGEYLWTTAETGVFKLLDDDDNYLTVLTTELAQVNATQVGGVAVEIDETFKAAVDGVPAAVKEAMEAEGSLLKETHTAATETIPTAIGEIEGGGGGGTVNLSISGTNLTVEDD